jgi:hypothetical protein
VSGASLFVPLAFATMILAACQSTPPPPTEAGAVTVGDWAVTTAGRVRVDSGVVN